MGTSQRTRLKHHIELEPDEEIYVDHHDPKALHDILDTQHKISEYMQKQNYKNKYCR